MYVFYVHSAPHCDWWEARICPVRPLGCGLCGAYVVAVGVIAYEFVVAFSACAGALRVGVIKRHIAVCTYAWVRFRYGV